MTCLDAKPSLVWLITQVDMFEDEFKEEAPTIEWYPGGKKPPYNVDFGEVENMDVLDTTLLGMIVYQSKPGTVE